ncbi:MAG: hypothetical protein WBN22_08190 [Verrucomicrobiia bacterium]
MQSASIRKWLLALTLLAVILWTIVHFYNQNAQTTGNITRIVLVPQGDFNYHKTNILSAKLQKNAADTDPQKILRQKVEEWLALHHRSATSLLAAFHVLNDTNYLREAATNFPNNPRVEWTILARNVFPEDRGKWLDLFKASSPSNSLANYLSAQFNFQNGQSEAAVKDLVAATGKPEFENYTLESQLDAEELGQFLGKSALDSTETALTGSSGDTQQELATLKQLASQMEDLQKQELNVGDNNSAENLAQMGMLLGSQLNSGASGNYIINQLVGMAVEEKMFDQLDPNTSYDFLDGETPDQRLQELKQQKAALSQLDKSVQAIQPSLTDAEIVSYQERIKIYGEVTAMRWLLQQHGTSQNGQ